MSVEGLRALRPTVILLSKRGYSLATASPILEVCNSGVLGNAEEEPAYPIARRFKKRSLSTGATLPNILGPSARTVPARVITLDMSKAWGDA
jgi:hypothetical protein